MKLGWQTHFERIVLSAWETYQAVELTSPAGPRLGASSLLKGLCFQLDEG